MPSVEIYTKAFCGFCSRALHLLRSKGVEFREYAVDGGGPRREEMIERSGGRTTVPQIFIDGQHVGGCNDLLALEREGRLDDLLKAE
ncbi:MAG: glutaredoxin 3 [Alphaproteobacteria bacterium]